MCQVLNPRSLQRRFSFPNCEFHHNYLIEYPVYATTGGSPYVYRNFMVCTQRMGDNEMRRPHVIGRAY